MNFSEINWDINYAGRWPFPVKLGIVLIFCAVVIGAWYYFDTQEQIVQLDGVRQKEPELRTAFENKYKKVVNLEEYKQQLVEMEKAFGEMLRQLPDKTQVPELLIDVSQTGLASGLEFELFKPQGEIKKDFYAELPIDIRVVGDYAKFGTFVSGLASLPRIVTIHNVRIKELAPGSAQTGKKKEDLVMETQVKTYRYLEEGELVPAKPTPAAGGKN
jgi:type IV pilus assembly protein PilO